MENILINIDSRYRNKNKYPNPGLFVYNLPDPIKNVSSIRLASIELPLTFYTFTESYQNINFYIQAADITITDASNNLITIPGDTYEIIIKEGNYTSDYLVNYIQEMLNVYNNANGLNFSVSWDNINYKITFKNVNPFSLKFGINNAKTPLGYYLGFRNTDDSYDINKVTQPTISENGQTIYYWNSDTFLDSTKEEYAFVRINDYNIINNIIINSEDVVVTKNNEQYLKSTSIIKAKPILAKIILYDGQFVFDNGANFLTKEYKFKNPVNLSRLEIELFLPNGYTINMNQIDYSLTLEIGQIYDSRNYENYNFKV